MPGLYFLIKSQTFSSPGLNSHLYSLVGAKLLIAAVREAEKPSGIKSVFSYAGSVIKDNSRSPSPATTLLDSLHLHVLNGRLGLPHLLQVILFAFAPILT